MSERWRPVQGYEGFYEVSDRGRVKRVKAGQGAVAGRIMSQSGPDGSDGYRYVALSMFDVKRKLPVHQLVASAFCPGKTDGKHPNHKNFKRWDNRASNLEWLTNLENVQHAAKAGRHGGRPMPGEENPRAKLTAAQVSEIRAQKGRVGQRILASQYGVSRSAIQFIHQNKHWVMA